MTFLAPIAGIIAGAVAAPLLALLYFLKLRRRPLRVSSTLLWRRAVEDLQVNAPFRWLRPSLLLLLQLLALALLALAFARPAIESATAPAERLILLVDASASMAAPAGADDDRTRLEAARDRARELVDRLSGAGTLGGSQGAEVMIISFAGAASAVTNFTADRAALRRALEDIEPTDQPGALDRALRLVEAQLAGASEQGAEPRARIVLFSDGAFDRAARDIRAAGPADVRFVRVGPAPDAPRDNLAIVAASARRDYDDPTLLRVFARVENTGDSAVEAALSVRFGEQTVEGRTLTVPPADDTGPGEAASTFQFNAPAQGLLRLSLPRPDALLSDNDAALLVPSARAARIVIVTPGGEDAAANFALQALVQGLESVVDREPRLVSRDEYETLAARPGAFDEVDLVVFNRVAPTTLPPVPSVSFGAGVPRSGVIVEEHGDEERSVRFVNWKRTHPTLRNVNLDAVLISNPLRLSIPGDGAADPENAEDDLPTGAVATPLAWGPESPLIVELEQETRRRLIVGFPLVRSTWPLEPGFVVFLANVVDEFALGGDQASARSFSTAEPVSVRVAPGVDRLAVSGPRDLEIEVEPNAIKANLGLLPLTGVYRVRGAVEADRILPVNLFDSVESAIATAESVNISGQRAEAGAIGDAAPREIWPWFVAAALALLTIEWLLYAWRMRV